jgi:hypothetical protein
VENETLRQSAIEPQQSSAALDLESIRDRYLASLKLGTQSPQYKAAAKALNHLIASIRFSK